MSLTSTQQHAVRARGNILVMAGAGTGKTHTLVEACAQRLLGRGDTAREGDEADGEVGIDEILMVTFTEAAAAEIRQRIRSRLERELEEDPGHGRIHAQLAGLDTAHISTLHSFCLRLIREHFHELGIDPEMSVLAEEQSALLASETLDDLFEFHYTEDTLDSEAVRRFLREQTRGWEDRARDLILEIHHFTQTRPDPSGWFRDRLAEYARTEPDIWREWLGKGFVGWREDWLPVLAAQDPDNTVARACCEILQSVCCDASQATDWPHGSIIGRVTRQILDQDASEKWPTKLKTKFRKPIETMFEEADFLNSLTPSESGTDPLTEDWQWIRDPMGTLVRLSREFADRFAEAKRERGCLDFHDLEQMSLRLLWNSDTKEPTALAEQWRTKFKLIFVDEYQDINAAQDTILRALSRAGDEANRFLVGDVKQSIYRFRQAAPRIFQSYARLWAKTSESGQAIFLQENFRSREPILEFVNAFFAAQMRSEIGGVAYDESARLLFGASETRSALASSSDNTPRVEVLLHLKAPSDSSNPDPAILELNDTESEARRIGHHLRNLLESSYEVWDSDLQSMRPVAWRDMVILLRSPRAKVESYAKEFARLGIPLESKRTGFFDSLEVRDLLNLLRLLDNPLQDLPAVAVLRSPLGGLSVNELATVRLAAPKTGFWTALRVWHRKMVHSSSDEVPNPSNSAPADCDPTLWDKVDTFLTRFDRWRAQARHTSLSQRLEMVLTETHYLDWLHTQERGEQRQANVRQLMTLAREFDELHAQGLHRFLKMIEAQQEVAGDREPAPLETAQAVRLMSIHQSKGLEFPVVVVANLGKKFNLQENRHGLILDEEMGLCPQVRPPGEGSYYPSLPLWLAKRRQRAESLGEEMRILYVAMTRAQDTLILSGGCTETSAREKWPRQAACDSTPHTMLRATSYMDWLGPWLTHSAKSDCWVDQEQGNTRLWRWRVYADDDSGSSHEIPLMTAPQEPAPALNPISDRTIEELTAILDWTYPFKSATQAPSKTSVTALRRQWNTIDEEAAPASFIRDSKISTFRPKQEMEAGELGSVYHKFLECVRLDRVGNLAQLEEEAQRLRREGRLKEHEACALDLSRIGAFWESAVGREILLHESRVVRELPFTCRLSHNDLESMTENPLEGVPKDDFMIVQGVADLAVLLDREIWILDFKTDHFPKTQLANKTAAYAPQLRVYGMALERIYGRPVTRRWLHFLSWQHTEEISQAPFFQPA